MENKTNTEITLPTYQKHWIEDHEQGHNIVIWSDTGKTTIKCRWPDKVRETDGRVKELRVSLMKIKTKLKGCAAEHYAVYHFQKQGLYVFKSNQTHCPIDLITLDPETRTMELWDVKCAAHRKDGTHINRTKRKSAKDLNVKIIYYEKGKAYTKPSRKRIKNKKV